MSVSEAKRNLYAAGDRLSESMALLIGPAHSEAQDALNLVRAAYAGEETPAAQELVSRIGTLVEQVDMAARMAREAMGQCVELAERMGV